MASPGEFGPFTPEQVKPKSFGQYQPPEVGMPNPCSPFLLITGFQPDPLDFSWTSLVLQGSQCPFKIYIYHKDQEYWGRGINDLTDFQGKVLQPFQHS